MLAGIATDFNPANHGAYDGFFSNLISYLNTQLTNLGYKPTFNVIYPYGVGSNIIITANQMLSVLDDINSLFASVRINAAVSNIKNLYDKESKVIFIGHSGGGVAGYEALKILGDESTIPVKHLIMVGSPKVRVKSYVHKTTALYDRRDIVVNNIGDDFENHHLTDDVIYYKPGDTIDDVNLILDTKIDPRLGGHMDYFKEDNYINVGGKILQVIKGAII